MSQIFIAWTGFMRRPESMQSHFNYELIFIPPIFTRKFLKPIDYINKSYHTLRLLFRKQPEAVWVQVAPTPLLYMAFLYKLFYRKTHIIADCHNSMFRPPWIRFPWAVYLLNCCQLVLAHNEKIIEKAINYGVKKEKLFILEDRPAEIGKEIVHNAEISAPLILLPCSFDSDEPIHVVFDAARMMHDINLVITGNTDRAKGRHDLRNAPDNVRFTGFLPKPEYNVLLHAADVVMGLTTRDDVQLSVANEAVGARKPMVISDTPLLRSLFDKGAVYVDSLDAAAIARGCIEAVNHKEQLIIEAQLLNKERNNRWLNQAQQLFSIIPELRRENLKQRGELSE